MLFPKDRTWHYNSCLHSSANSAQASKNQLSSIIQRVQLHLPMAPPLTSSCTANMKQCLHRRLWCSRFQTQRLSSFLTNNQTKLNQKPLFGGAFLLHNTCDLTHTASYIDIHEKESDFRKGFQEFKED